MAFSYSFHMSAKSHAVNTIGKVTQVSRHNLREYESKDYDKSQIEILRGSDSSILDDVKRIYHDEFDEPVKRYNEGKRADRQIEDYLQHVSDSRSDVACEFIIQVGDKDFWENKTMDEKRQMTFIFKDQLRALEKLVPELKVASAVIHYDESSPHMHVVGVPVAEGYKKGLEKQVAKTKVFTKERLSYLQDKLRENAEKGMKLPENQNLFDKHELKPKEKGRNKDLPKKALAEYNENLQEIAQNTVNDIKQQIDQIKVPEEPKDTFGKPEFHAVNSMITALDSASKTAPVGEDKDGNPLIEVKFRITKDFLGNWINLLTRLKDLMNIYKAKEKAVQKIKEVTTAAKEKVSVKGMLEKYQAISKEREKQRQAQGLIPEHKKDDRSR